MDPHLTRFLGVDLGWHGKPTGLASLKRSGAALILRGVQRVEPVSEILAWIESETADGTAVVGVDAPLVIPNATGTRLAERELNRDFRRFHAGCHPANLGRPFAAHVTGFSRALETLGFAHGAAMSRQQPGRFQIEVHPHASSVVLFGLGRIVKYKRGLRATRAGELTRLRRLLLERLPDLDPPLTPKLPPVPRRGPLKPAEDQIDAVLCAYTAAYWWWWGTSRNRVYGSGAEGYIVVPQALSD
ncbi:MAG: DUF429 domain-containing protein [Acidobacteria bacterium]|nr:DUF429 domain-containing protein [Acidobacteriota bacterium]